MKKSLTFRLWKDRQEHTDFLRCKVKSIVGVADNDEKGGLSVAYGVKLHFVGFHKLPQFLNVEWG